MGAFFFVYLVLFIVFRFCAVLCCCKNGCCRLCCGTVSLEDRTETPSLCKRRSQFAMMLLAILIIVVACGIGIAGVEKASDSIVEIADSLESEVQQAYNMTLLA